MSTFPKWETQVLHALGAPATPSNIRFLDAWARSEGGTAAFNPLNTTQSARGAGTYNSVGVRSYGSPQEGLQATVATLKNGHYDDILDGLRRSADPGQLAAAVGNSPWGTSGDLLARVLGEAPGGRQDTSSDPTTPLAPPTQPSSSTPGLDPLNASSASGLQDLISGSYSPEHSLSDLRALMEAHPQTQRTARPGQPQMPALPQVDGVKTKRDQQAAALVHHYLGVQYEWGGESPAGFDCSGLLQYVWGKVGIGIPRTTYEQWGAGTKVSRGKLRVGDAVFFRGSDPDAQGRPGHVGFYIGGGKFIEAPHTGAVVRVAKLAGRADYMGARRFG